MSESLTWQVGNRLPSITENLVYTDGTAVDLSSSTVMFKMREVGSSTLKVNAAATIVAPPTAGNVRYDWAAIDVDTAGTFLVWWQVTTAGKTQDMREAAIVFEAHAPANGYVELEELRSTLEIRETTTPDKDVRLAIEAASSVVDMMCGRTFATVAADTRKYTPVAEGFLPIDTVTSVTSLTVNDTAWTVDVDYYVSDEGDTIYTLNGRKFYRGNQSVTLVANFGYAEVPAEIKAATTIIAAQILRRAREATFGVLALTLDGSAIRIGRSDPQVDLLLARYRRVLVE